MSDSVTKDGRPIVAVDFDGTVVRHQYPEVGEEISHAADGLRMLRDCGCRLILWTMRSGDELQAAVDWYGARDIPLWGVNTNSEQKDWTLSPKAYAQLYIDDAALGCPLTQPPDGSRPYADWRRITQLVYLWLSAQNGTDVRAIRRYRDHVDAVRRGVAPRAMSSRLSMPKKSSPTGRRRRRESDDD